MAAKASWDEVVEAGVEHGHHHALAVQAQLVGGGYADLGELAGGEAVVEGGGAARGNPR